MENKKLFTDLITSLVLLLFAGTMLREVHKLPLPSFDQLGAGFVPELISYILLLLSLLLLGRSLFRLKQHSRSNTDPAAGTTKPLFLPASACVVLTFLYILVMPSLGYTISTFVFINLLGLILLKHETRGEGKKCLYLAIILLISLVFAFGGYYLFTHFLAVDLPVFKL